MITLFIFYFTYGRFLVINLHQEILRKFYKNTGKDANLRLMDTSQGKILPNFKFGVILMVLV